MSVHTLPQFTFNFVQTSVMLNVADSSSGFASSPLSFIFLFLSQVYQSLWNAGSVCRIDLIDCFKIELYSFPYSTNKSTTSDVIFSLTH